jgi:hypothetical protein
MATGNFMQKMGSGWLRASMQKFTGKNDGADLSTNALLSDVAKNSEQILLHRVNELLEGKNKHFAESDAEKLIEQAMKIAREKIQSAEFAKCAVEAEKCAVETQKCAAEAELTRYRNQVKSEIDIKLLEIEVRMQAMTSQLAAAAWRAIAAGERANKAEATVRHLEDELQSQMMRAGPRLVRSAA